MIEASYIIITFLKETVGWLLKFLGCTNREKQIKGKLKGQIRVNV